MSEASAKTRSFGVPYEARLRPLTALGVSVLGLWMVWASLLQLVPTLASPGSAIGARLLFWVLPCVVYLRHVDGRAWLRPLGLGFPYGLRQVVLSILVFLAIGGLLLLGTARQEGVSVGRLLDVLARQAQPRLTAPVFEELVFRGVLLSEALTWARLSARDWGALRSRFWGAQLAVALVFTAVHWPWLWLELGPRAALTGSGPLFLTGLVLGVAFASTRSLWVVIGLHFLNNELSVLAW